MSKKSRNNRNRTLQLNKPLPELSAEELAALSDVLPARHPYGIKIVAELKRRMDEMLATAPSPEARRLAEDLMDPKVFEQFLMENENAAELFSEAVAHAGSQAQIERVVDAINASNSDLYNIHVDDIWDAWPLFVEECYAGKHPEQFSEFETYQNDFIHWMITSKNHLFYRLVNDKKGIAWLRDVAEICVQRRLLEWKYIQLTEYGRDIFDDPEVRDEILRKAQTGEWVLWKSTPESERAR